MKKRMMRHNTKMHTLVWLCAVVLCAVALPTTARAQDFYGEGNVLIAVDLAPYAVNEAVSYPTGTMGTLVWGDDAPSGTSTRPAFRNHVYEVSPDVTPVPAPVYTIATTYTVGQKLFFPYWRLDGTDDAGFEWITADKFPREVFDEAGAPRFLIHSSWVKTENGVTWYKTPSEKVNGETHLCVDFLEIECVEVTQYSTVWQYTGNAYSNRNGFNPDDYIGAVNLTDAELQFFLETCDNAYAKQAQIYGDPHWEDARGDCDGKAAYVALDLSVLKPYTTAYYGATNTDIAGFDCLIIGANFLPDRRPQTARKTAEDSFMGTLVHELNHYIVKGCIGHENERWSMWMGESFAQSAIYTVRPENISYLQHRVAIEDKSSRLRMIPGILWAYGASNKYLPYKDSVYALGPYFLRFVERETTGRTDGRLWTNYLAHRTPEGSITAAELDGYLSQTTGEGIDAWMVRFMAAVVADTGSGAVVPIEYGVDPLTFFRPHEDYGKNLSFDGAVDEAVKAFFQQDIGVTAVAGGGTTYAWRNDAGGKIAITGADDRWYFTALNMELPTEREVIDIDSAEKLAKIGKDPAYPLYGSYRLTVDLDLGGTARAWTPVGMLDNPFNGIFDGDSHTIRGLYIDSASENRQGLFGEISGNAEIRNLTVYGSVTGKESVGGLVGFLYGGAVRNCTSYVTVAGKENCGGIVGYHYLGTVENCTVAGTVLGGKCIGGVAGYGSWAAVKNCTVTGTVAGDSLIGGITGFNDGCTVSTCSAQSDVSGSVCVGGIVGYILQYATVQNCYHSGRVTGESGIGGVAGMLCQTNSILQNCYHVGTVTGETHIGGIAGRVVKAEAKNCYSYYAGLPAFGSTVDDEITGCYVLSETGGEDTLTAAQFAVQSSFAGWDFNTVWSLESGVRPVLRSNMEQIAPAPSPVPSYDSGDDDDGYDEPRQTSATPAAPVAPTPTVPAPATPADPSSAVLSPQKLTVNDAEQNVEAYNIGGANFFKLRDLAALLKGTSAQFNVDYDAARNTVVITKGASYAGEAGSVFADRSASAVISPQTVEIDGQVVALTAYNIGGNNFFGLRELSEILGYGVSYDEATNTARIESK